MKVVLVMIRDGERRDFPLTAPKFTLGRRTDCNLRIPTKDVSRQHCQIVLQGGAVRVKDLGSSNGTFVNGKRVAETELKAGDKLAIGPVLFFVQIDGKPAEFKAEDAAAAAAAAAANARRHDDDDDGPELIGADDDTGEILDLDDLDLEGDEEFSAIDILEELEDDEDDETRV